MNRILAFLAFYSIATFGFAQQQKIDSLQQVVQRKDLSISDELNALNKLGQLLRQSKPRDAAEYLFKSLSLAEKAQDSVKQAAASILLGNILLDQGQYQQSINFFLKANDLYENQKDTVGTIRAKHGLGRLFNLLKKPKKGVQYFEDALRLALAYKNEDMLMRCYMNLGVACQEAGYNDKALINYEKFNELAKKKKTDENWFAVLYNNMSVVLQSQKKYKQALDYERKSYPIVKKLNDPIDLSKAALNFSELYLNLNKVDSSIYWSRQSLRLALENKFPDQAMDAYKWLGTAYSKKGNSKDALLYYQKYVAIKDSLFDQKELGVIQQLYEGYQLGKKEEKINSLKAEQERLALDLRLNQVYSILSIVIAISLIIISGIIFYYYFQKQKLATELERQNEEIKTQNEEITMQSELIDLINKDLKVQALRAQMNPHFIFNSLNSIQFLIMKNETESAFDYLAKFAQLLRRVMDNSTKNWIPLIEEVELLQLYIELESLRFDGSFSHEIKMDMEDAGAFKIPPMVIQPYVENAILHGLMPKEDNRKLSITFIGKGKQLTCEIWDNGIGRKEANKISERKSKIFASKGMNFISERLQVLNTTGEGMAEVNIIDRMENETPAGTSVKVSFKYA